MSLLTTCPRCASQFRIRPEQLAAGGGWAQCGVCGTMFDARATLIPEEAPAAAVPAVEVSQPPPAPAAEAAAVPVESSAAVTAAPAAGAVEEAPLPAGILSRQTARSEGTELHSIILVDPDAPVPEEPETLPVISPLPGPSAVAAAAAVVAAAPAVAPAMAPAPAPAAREQPPEAVPRRAFWASLAFLLLLVLAAQGIYFQRDALVQNVPALRPALQQICAWTGCRLVLPHDIRSLAIIGSELQVSPRNAHVATLRVTLANQGESVQAWPKLKLSLQGLDGRTHASEILTPEEYLHGADLLGQGLPAQSQHTARVELTVEGPPLLSSQPYSLDIFY